MNQVYEAEESPEFARGGDKGNQAEGDDHGWTQVTRRRWKQPNKASPEAEKLTLKAEKDNVRVKSNRVTVRDARETAAKPGKKNFGAEAERTRGTRARDVPPPTNQESRWKQQSQPAVEEQR